MTMGVVYKLSSAINEAVERIRTECGANCKVRWIRRAFVRKGDYVVTPNGEIARIEKRRFERMTEAEIDRWKKRHPGKKHPRRFMRRILELVEIWPTRGTSLKHTRPGDKALMAAFRITGAGMGHYDEDEVQMPGGMGDYDDFDAGDMGDFDEDDGMGQLPMLRSAIDAARFPLKPGDLPDTTFVTEQGLRRQDVRLGDDANNYGM
jgi:hypothetical protein